MIKQTRTRIEVVRRKRNATQKFLRKDIADLLANGLEKNALGRVSLYFIFSARKFEFELDLILLYYFEMII